MDAGFVERAERQPSGDSKSTANRYQHFTTSPPNEFSAPGPAPQTGMEKPGMTKGAKPDGSMDTTGMSSTKGNVKRDKDGAPAPVKQNDTKK